MKHLYLAFVCLCWALGLSAQTLDMEKLAGMKPRNIGPAGMSGRITAIDVVRTQPDIIYAGTASGGLWRSESGGTHWEPVFDKQETASIGAVAIQQSNPEVVWVGTGEGNPRNSLNGGYGIYRSLDGGRNWQHMGLEKTRHIHRIVLHPNDPNTVYVAAIGSPWGAHPERGVYKTTDGGKSWKKILSTNEYSGAADLVIDPSNPNKLIAALWDHHRQPWSFRSGGPGSGLYVTYDGGESWTKRTEKDGLPKGELGRIGLAISASKPSVVYALIESEKNALYRSEDGGFSWKMINDKSDIGNRPFYYSEIYVDPSNENRVYSLFTYVNVSEDGGKNFHQLMPAYGSNQGIHPDHHAWYIHPDDPSFMINGNDGGLNITRDMGKTWRFVETLPIAQFYHIAVDMDLPYNVYGGMQDNGSWSGPAYVWRAQGIRNSYWQELMFGDGFDVQPDPDDSRYGYAMSQEGFVGRYDRQTGYTDYIRPTHPDADMRLRFNWNAAIALDPFSSNTLYFGSQFVHKSTDKGLSWEIISPDLTTNDTTQQKQHESGGLTMDATGAENYNTILAIEPSPLQEGLIWVGSDDGKLHLSRDGGKSWADLSDNIKGMPKGSWIPQIRASRYNPAEAFVVVNDYRRFNYTPYLFRTRDYGKNWERMVDETDAFAYTLSFIQDTEEPRLMFLGTDDGLYVSLNEGRDWTKWTKGFPTVPVADLAIHPREHDLVIGTYGRSAWIIDDIRPLRALAKQPQMLASSRLKLFSPPTAYDVSIQQPTGSRFGAFALYNGDNRETGAMISYLINRPAEEKKAEQTKDGKKNTRAKATSTPEPKAEAEKVSYDSLKLEVLKDGEVIRTITRLAPEENGLHRMYWGLEEKGSFGPSRKQRERKGEPGGLTVLPGTYTLRMSFGEASDSTEITVEHDPRLNVPMEVLQARYAEQKKLLEIRAVAAEAAERLAESRQLTESYQNRLKDKTGDTYAALREQSQAVQDSIAHLFDALLGKEDKRQGITASPTRNPMDYLGTASWYMGNTLVMPGPTEERLVQQAKDKLFPVLERINRFYAEVWPGYRKTAESTELSEFEEYEPLKVTLE